MRGLAIALLVTGCGYHPSTGEPSVVDADPDSTTAADVGTDTAAPTCWSRWLDHTIAFGAPVPLAAVNTAQDDRDPWVSPDQLTLLFASDRAGSQMKDIYRATRSSVTADFSTPAKAAGFNSTEDDSKASLTGDQLIAVVNSRRGGGGAEGQTDIWMARRATTADSFTFSQTGMSAINNSGEQRDAEISVDGKALYYTEGSNPQHVVVSTRATVDDAWSGPVDVINSGAGDGDPTVSADGLVIVFTSKRTTTFPGDNLWYATRATTTAAFGPADLVPGVNSSADDGDASLTPDGCRLYLSNNAGVAQHTLFQADAL